MLIVTTAPFHETPSRRYCGIRMVSDQDTSEAYISDLLPQRHGSVAEDLRKALGSRLKIIQGTKDIWCRDYMPVQVAQDRFVQFHYCPDYLKGYPHERTENAGSLL